MTGGAEGARERQAGAQQRGEGAAEL